MGESASGILRRDRDGARLFNAVQPAAGEVLVPARLVQEYALVEGASVSGPGSGHSATAATASCPTRTAADISDKAVPMGTSLSCPTGAHLY